MIVKEKKCYLFHALVEGEFEDKKTSEKIHFHTVLAFPIEENGTIGVEQKKLKIHRDTLESLKKLKQGDRVIFEMGAFVKDDDMRIYAVEDDFFE